MIVNGLEYKLFPIGCAEGMGVYISNGIFLQHITTVPYEDGYEDVARAALITLQAIEKARLAKPVALAA